MSLTPLPPSPTPSPPPPQRKVHLWGIYFALPAMTGPLPAGLKFKENTAKQCPLSVLTGIYINQLM